MTKKILALILALIFALTACTVAFAADEGDGEGDGNGSGVVYEPEEPDEPDQPATTGYNFREDETLQTQTDMSHGEFAFGRPAACMYNITEGKAYTLADAEENGFEDAMGSNVDTATESVKIVAFYAFKCPNPDCGKANGGQSLYEIYFAASHPGKCAHCGELLPDYRTVDVYRFLIVDPESVHLGLFSDMNYVNRTKNIFKETASQYAGGKDLPQSFLIYETVVDEEAQSEETVFVDFKTSGLATSSARALFYDFLIKYELWEERHLEDETTIKVYNAMGEAMVKFVEAMGKFFRLLPGLIF